jgi:hypothetical protein
VLAGFVKLFGCRLMDSTNSGGCGLASEKHQATGAIERIGRQRCGA